MSVVYTSAPKAQYRYRFEITSSSLGAILYAVVRVEMIAQMSRDSDSLSASSNLPRDSR